MVIADIELKILNLMEDSGASADYEQEVEALSLKLKEVKYSLEEFQMMLQEKCNEEQVKHMNAMQSKSERVMVL